MGNSAERGRRALALQNKKTNNKNRMIRKKRETGLYDFRRKNAKKKRVCMDQTDSEGIAKRKSSRSPPYIEQQNNAAFLRR